MHLRQRSLMCSVALVAGLLASASFAVPIIDGQRDVDYGAPIVVQTTGTQFGDVTAPGGSPLQASGGSELDAGYAFISGGKLHLFFAGNLESNFNKLDIFIDSKAGGQNQLRGDNPDVEFNNLNRMGNDGTNPGLKFDAGFEADHFFTLTNGNLPVEMYSSYADLRTAGGGNGTYIGSNGGGDNPLLDARVNGDLANPLLGIQWGLNNTNIAGVGSFGSANVSDPATVTTGVELVIPLTYLEDTTGPIRVVAFVNGSSHDFLSNQILGPVDVAQGNLGEPRTVDFSALAGDQFFAVPGTSVNNVWGNNSSGAISNAANFTQGVAPITVDQSAIFAGGTGTNVNVNVDVAATVNRLVLSTRNFSLSGTGSLTLGGLNFAAVQVDSGTHVVAVPVTLNKNVQFNVGAGASLSLTGDVAYTQKYIEKTGDGSLTVPNVRTSTLAVYGGTVKVSGSDYSSLGTLIVGTGAKLDIGSSALILDYTDANTPYATIREQVLDGRLASSAVTSSVRAIGIADTATFGSLTSISGQPLDSTAVVALATLKGDTNLDKTVNFDDLLGLAQSYDLNGTGKLWTQGDSNYDGVVNFDDLLSLAQNYGASALANGSIAVDQQLHDAFASDWAMALSMVPEPASLSVLTLGGMLLGRRRK